MLALPLIVHIAQTMFIKEQKYHSLVPHLTKFRGKNPKATTKLTLQRHQKSSLFAKKSEDLVYPSLKKTFCSGSVTLPELQDFFSGTASRTFETK